MADTQISWVDHVIANEAAPRDDCQGVVRSVRIGGQKRWRVKAASQEDRLGKTFVSDLADDAKATTIMYIEHRPWHNHKARFT